MRKFHSFILSTTLLALTACAHQNATPKPESAAASIPHVKRPNLVVADIDRALTLYQDILGLEAGIASVSEADSFSYPVFNIPKGTPIRSITLNEPGEARSFAMTEVKAINLPRPPSAPHMSAVVIGINDLERKFKALEALGLKITESRISSGADFKFVEQAFVDFDGHLIV